MGMCKLKIINLQKLPIRRKLIFRMGFPAPHAPPAAAQAKALGVRADFSPRLFAAGRGALLPSYRLSRAWQPWAVPQA